MKDILCIIFICVVGLIAGLMFFYFKTTDEIQFEQYDRVENKIDMIDRRLLDNGFLLNK